MDEIDDMADYCKNCGKELVEGAAFCSHCASLVDSVHPQETTPAVQPLQQVPQAPVSPPPVPSGKRSSGCLIAALVGAGILLLLFALGGCGYAAFASGLFENGGTAWDSPEIQATQNALSATRQALDEGAQQFTQFDAPEATQNTVLNPTRKPSLVPESTDAPAPTPIPTRPVAFDYTIGGVIYSNNFEAGRDDFRTYKGDSCDSKVKNGRYTITVNKENWLCPINYTKKELTNFSMQVDLVLKKGVKHAGSGLVFHFVDKDNYYKVDISNGDFISAMKKKGKWTDIVDWTSNPAINTSGETNWLNVVAKNGRFAILINGTLVGTFRDTSLAKGKSGIFCGTFEGNDNVTCEFDNFKINSVQ